MSHTTTFKKEWSNRVRAVSFFASAERVDRTSERWFYQDNLFERHMTRLEELGVMVWIVDDDRKIDTMLLELPEQLHREVVEIVGKMSPDECDLKGGVLRLWWD